MNKYTHAIWLIFTIISLSTHCSQNPWYMRIKEDTTYIISTLTTDITMTIKKAINRPMMAINPDKYIALQKKQLTLIEKDLRAQEESIIRDIAKENELTSENATELITILNSIHDSYKKHLSTHQPTVFHDTRINPQFVNIITQQLKKSEFTINSINLIQNDDPNNNHLATADGPSYEITIDNGTISASYGDQYPGNITFYPKFLHLKTINQHTACIHEATHIIKGHNITQSFIQNYINRHNKKTVSDIEQGQAFQELIRLHEHSAEVLPSLHDSHTASLMRSMRSRGYDPNMLYREHYAQLSRIDEIHKNIAYLKSIKKKMMLTPNLSPIKEIAFHQPKQVKNRSLFPRIDRKLE